VAQALKTSDVSFDELELPPDGSLTIGAQSEEPKPSFPGNDEVGASAGKELEKRLSKQDAIPEKRPMMTPPSRFVDGPGLGLPRQIRSSDVSIMKHQRNVFNANSAHDMISKALIAAK
jgi:hypothetical protein